MTVGNVYDALCNDKLLVVNEYDDDAGTLEEVYSSALGDALPTRFYGKQVTFMDVIRGGLVVEYNKEG